MENLKSDTVIKVENLNKIYRLGVMGGRTLSEDIQEWFRSLKKKEKLSTAVSDSRTIGNLFTALSNINFEVAKGEILGIIGRNGAGKSTLLKLLSQITTPSSGEICIKGRIASLLEVGTGFHPELSGRENIYLNGAILGMTKAEINSKMKDIIDFSGIQSHMDTPVKRYSSGMKVRLGFAVAAHLEPEILVIDEVLAVGDMEFQRKCLGKMNEVANSGRTILFVSHNMSSVRNLCTKCMVLDEGKIIFIGDTDKAIELYANLNSTKNTDATPVIDYQIDKSKHVQFSRIELSGFDLKTPMVFEFDNQIKLRMTFKIHQKIPVYFFLGITLRDTSDNIIAVFCDDDNEESKLKDLPIGEFVYELFIPKELLKPNKYYLSFSLRTYTDLPFDLKDKAIQFEVVDTKTYRGLKENYRSAAIVAPYANWVLSEV